MQYEINYLVLQSKTKELDTIREQIKNLFSSHTATITGEKNYLKRKLAYDIKHESYGFYTVLRFSLQDSAHLQEIKKDLNLHSSVARYIIVKADELPPLEEVTAKETAEQIESKEQTIKQADVEKMITQNKTEELRSKTSTEEKPQAEPHDPTHAKEGNKEDNVVDEKVQPETAQQEKKEAVAETQVKPQQKETPSEEKEDEAVKKKKEEKASLEELDKKLDEILNI